MKNLFILVTACLFFVGCSNSDDDMVADVMNDSMEIPDGNYSMGDFVSLAHPTTGKASVNSAKSVLTLENFKTDDGPKLLLYLSSDNDATEFVDLGDLKGIEGDFVYEIPANTNLDKFNVVNVWCVDFLVSFGVAELKKN